MQFSISENIILAPKYTKTTYATASRRSKLGQNVEKGPGGFTKDDLGASLLNETC